MRKITGLVMMSVILVMAAAARADVVIKMTSSVNTMGMVNADIQSTENVKPDMSATENVVTFKGSMMTIMGQAPEQKTIDIDRLDKGLRWELNPEDKTYAQQNLKDIRQIEGQEQGGESEMFGEAENYTWTVDITNEDDPVDINGFKCKGIIATAKGISKADSTEKTDFYFEYWYAKDVPGYDDLIAYQKKYAEITGMDYIESQKDVGQMIGKFGEEFDDIFSKMAKAEGYPIKTVVTVKGSAKYMGDVRDEQTQKGAQPGMMEMYKGMTGGAAQPETEGGMATLLSVTNTVQSIKVEPVESTVYDIPEGFEEQ